MTREQIVTELASLKQQIREKMEVIREHNKMLFEFQKEHDRRGRGGCCDPGHTCHDMFEGARKFIYGLRSEVDKLEERRSDLRLELHRLSDRDLSRLRGTIKWFNPEKKYGFITIIGMEDVFVHQSSFVEKGGVPTEGMHVSFRRVNSSKGLQAVDVRILSE